MRWLGGCALVLLLTGWAEAQVAVTKCVATVDPKVMLCDGIVNSDLSLPPGSYAVNAVTQDSAGNRSLPVTVGTVVIKGPDAVLPVVEEAVLVPVAEGMWKAVFTCRDDVKCDGAEVTVTPAP